MFYYFSGYTLEQDNPVSRKLYLHSSNTGSLLNTTVSSGNGYYYMETLYSGSHYIVCLDDEAGIEYNDLIIGSASPNVASGTGNLYYGVSWDESQATGGYARTGDLTGVATGQSLADNLIRIQASMHRCVLNDSMVVQYYLDPSDSTKKANGEASDLTGADGQVMVEIPAFYYRYDYSGTTHTWDISLSSLPGFSLHPAFIKNGENVSYRYIGAYEGSMWDATDSQMVSDAEAVTNMYASGDKLCSVTGQCPKTYETRAEFRAMASERGTGWRQQDYDLVSAIQLLYLVEYASWNSQSMIGMGRTERTDVSWEVGSNIGRTGKSNSDGNGTNSVGGNTNDAYMTYRGIENFFGNVWKWIDGININNNIPYVCNNDTQFDDDTTTNYTSLGVTLPDSGGWQKTLEQISRGFLPASIGGGSSTYITDYYWQNSGWRVARVGGNAINGTNAGAAYWNTYYSSDGINRAVGSRASC